MSFAAYAALQLQLETVTVSATGTHVGLVVALWVPNLLDQLIEVPIT
jgi:hypothetical protein